MTQLVLHTGTPLTRQVDVQTQLVTWREALTKAGVILHPQDRIETWDTAVKQLVTGDAPPQVRKLVRQSSKFGARAVVLSSEDAYRPLRKARNVTRLADLGSASDVEVTVVLVVREQLELLNALYCRQVMSMDTAEDFASFVAKGIDSGLYHYAQAFRRLLDAEDVHLVAVPFSALSGREPARAILQASGVPAETLDGLPDSPDPAATTDESVGPILLAATRLLHKRLIRLKAGRVRRPGALDRAVDILREQARANDWDDRTFWGWTPELAALGAQAFHLGNAEFAAGAWRSDWPDASPTHSYTRGDLASRGPAVVVDVMDTVQRALDDLMKKPGKASERE